MLKKNIHLSIKRVKIQKEVKNISDYNIIEKVGISTKNYSDAVSNAIKAVQKERKVSWFEVIECRGRLNNNIIEYQAIVKIGV
jgi:flavin-binding protein dodecin